MSGTDLLMIEDDVDIAALAHDRAERRGIGFACTSHGLQGLERATQGAGLIVLDLELPDLHGHDILLRLSQLAPVVVFTGTTDQVRGSRRHGAIAHVPKPTDALELQAILDAMVDGARLLTAGDELDDEALDRVAEIFPGGPDAFHDSLLQMTAALPEAASSMRQRDHVTIAAWCHQLMPGVQRIGCRRMALQLALLVEAAGDEARLRAACMAEAMDRLHAHLQRIGLTVLN